MTDNGKKVVLALIAVAAAVGGYWFGARLKTHEAAAPPAVAEAARPLVRPQFTLNDVDGKARSSDEFAGKAVIFNFWATWCAPCRREIPLLNKLQAEYGVKGLQIVGIAVDTRENVRDYEKELKLEYLSLQGELEAMDVGRKFGQDLYGLPVSVFTDRQGRILGAHIGELTREEAEAYLAKML